MPPDKDRQVLLDCHSEQVAALVEENNKMAALLQKLVAGRPDETELLKLLPRPITVRRQQ